MIQHHGLEWYGEGATFAEVCNDYTKVEYKCNGIGVLYDYALFLGIDLIFMDFNCTDTFREPIPNKNIIEIRHYQKGRVEFELRNNKVFHIQRPKCGRCSWARPVQTRGYGALRSSFCPA